MSDFNISTKHPAARKQELNDATTPLVDSSKKVASIDELHILVTFLTSQNRSLNERCIALEDQLGKLHVVYDDASTIPDLNSKINNMAPEVAMIPDMNANIASNTSALADETTMRTNLKNATRNFIIDQFPGYLTTFDSDLI